MPLVKVADNWDTLSDAQKVALFEAAGDEMPSIDDLKTLGKFKIVTYSTEQGQSTCTVMATPKTQIILPKELLNIKKVEDINKITITQTIKEEANPTGNPAVNDIRFAFTLNGTDYKVYDILQNTWEAIQTAEIPTKGLQKINVEAIPKAAWHEFITEGDTKLPNKLGIAYSLSQRLVKDTVNIDDLSLQVDQKGKWQKSLNKTNYTVEYVDNENVEITLAGAGSYKINYALGG